MPIAQSYLDWLLATSETIQIALAEYPGTVTNNYPSAKILSLLQNQEFEEIPHRSEVPGEGLTVFTNAEENQNELLLLGTATTSGIISFLRATTQTLCRHSN